MECQCIHVVTKSTVHRRTSKLYRKPLWSHLWSNVFSPSSIILLEKVRTCWSNSVWCQRTHLEPKNNLSCATRCENWGKNFIPVCLEVWVMTKVCLYDLSRKLGWFCSSRKARPFTLFSTHLKTPTTWGLGFQKLHLRVYNYDHTYDFEYLKSSVGSEHLPGSGLCSKSSVNVCTCNNGNCGNCKGKFKVIQR